MHRSAFRAAPLAALLLTLAAPGAAGAVELVQGDWHYNINVVATIGAGIRTSDRDPALVPPGDGKVVGIKGTALGGSNADAGNLNYGKGDFVSSVVQSYGSIDMFNNAGYGAFVSAYGWYDYTAANSNVQLGNTPNGYQPDKPLSDRGFNSYAKFGNIVLEEAYLHGKTKALGGNIEVRLGQQSIRWGTSLTVPGGVREIDPRNFSAAARPGFQTQEAYIPFPAVSARWDVNPNLRLEAFYELQEAHSVLPGCGTYSSFNNYAPDGCNIVSAVPTLSNLQSIQARQIFLRSPDKLADNSGQFGLGGSYLFNPINTRVGLYVAQYAERNPQVDSIRGARLGFNGTYQISYPNGTKVASLMANTDLKQYGIKLAAEVDQNIDQPFAYNATDTLTAALQGRGPLAARFISAAPGTHLRNYDRHATTQLGLAADKVFHGVAGADEAQFGVEVGGKFVEGLPPLTQVRYGRADFFGSGNGPGIVCATQLACSKAGFVTDVSWGYRLRGSLIYRNVGLPGITVVPSVTFFHDVNGTSSDGAFVEGRITLRAAVDANFGTRYFANASFTTTPGGNYNVRRDRDIALISLGIRL